MRSWGVIDKYFPKPNSSAFNRSKEDMDAIQLRIAIIEKAIGASNESEEKTNQGKVCDSTKHANPSDGENKNMIDTEGNTGMRKMKTKNLTQSQCTNLMKSQTMKSHWNLLTQQ